MFKEISGTGLRKESGDVDEVACINEPRRASDSEELLDSDAKNDHEKRRGNRERLESI